MKADYVSVPIDLLVRICKTFLELEERGGVKASDLHLMEDLDQVLKEHERKHYYGRR